MSQPIQIPTYENEDESIPDDEGRLALDIFETEEEIFIIAPLAGVDKEEVEISINEDILTIKGRREFLEDIPSAKTFFAEECFWGDFSRSIILPSAVNSADIKAKMKKNILIISVPKAKKASKKINIEKL